MQEGFHEGFHFSKVIEEIEEMMQESPDPEDDETPTQSDRLSILSQEIQTLKRSSTNNSYEESKWYLFSIFVLMLIENSLKGKFAMCLIHTKSFLQNICVRKYFQNVLTE